MEHLDFDLRLELSPEGLRVRVQNSPAGEEAQALVSLPRLAHDGTLERLGRAVQQSRDVEPAAGLPGEREPPREVAQRIGADLFEALFTGSVRQRFEESLVHAGSLPGQLLRVRLRYSLTEPELASAVGLPWEYMVHDGNFVGLSPAFSVVRYPEVDKPPSLPPFERPLRIALLSGHRRGTIREPLEDPEAPEADRSRGGFPGPARGRGCRSSENVALLDHHSSFTSSLCLWPMLRNSRFSSGVGPSL